MRVNIYAEEMTDRIEIIGKEIDGQVFTGLRFYLELPVTVGGKQVSGPFMHRPGDDDSAAVTFWGKRDLRIVLWSAISLLDRHYVDKSPPAGFSFDAAAVALFQAAAWFDEYEESHTRKGAIEKAKRNEDRANYCRQAAFALQSLLPEAN